MSNWLLCLIATGIVLTEVAVIGIISACCVRFYEITKPTIKKYEPALRQRVHEVAEAINW